MNKGMTSVRNGHAWRDRVYSLLKAWLRDDGIEIEKKNVFQDISGSMRRADVFIPAGLLSPPFDGPVIVEAKFQDGTGSAHERIWKDYINSLIRSPYATLFACDGEWYRPFVEWVGGHEAKTFCRVVGRMEIDAVLGTQELVNWYERHRKSLFD